MEVWGVCCHLAKEGVVSWGSLSLPSPQQDGFLGTVLLSVISALLVLICFCFPKGFF